MAASRRWPASRGGGSGGVGGGHQPVVAEVGLTAKGADALLAPAPTPCPPPPLASGGGRRQGPRRDSLLRRGRLSPEWALTIATVVAKGRRPAAGSRPRRRLLRRATALRHAGRLVPGRSGCDSLRQPATVYRLERSRSAVHPVPPAGDARKTPRPSPSPLQCARTWRRRWGGGGSWPPRRVTASWPGPPNSD